MKKIIHAIAAVAALSSGGTVLFAQTAQINGRVTDSSSAMIPGVRVEVMNARTGITRRTQTNSEGYYSVPLLPPGEYRVLAQSQGFKPSSREGILLRVDQSARLDFLMEIGALNESVVVQEGIQLLDFSTNAVGQVVDNRSITALPLNGRQFLQLATLAPGVATGVGYGAREPGMRGTLTNISVGGARPEFNNYLLDGVTNTDGNWNLMVTSPSVDTLQEFKVQTNSYSAEFGRSMGAQINAVTKSGGNSLHGSLYEFLRNDKVDALSYFALPGQRKPPYRQNQFGVSAGGPVVVPHIYNGRNRTFFFVNYEGLRIRQAQTQVSSVPTPALLAGNLSPLGKAIYDPASTVVNPNGKGYIRTPFAGSIIPAGRLDPIARAAVAYYPVPNVGSGLANNYVDNQSQRLDSNQLTVRVDQQITPNDNFYVRYIYTKEASIGPGSFPGFGTDTNAKPQNLMANYTRVISPNMINEFRAGFLRAKMTSFSLNAGQNDIVSKLGITGLDTDPRTFGIPNFAPTGFTALNDSVPDDQADNTFNWSESLTWSHGKHSLKFGADIRRFQFNLYSVSTPSGFTFNGAFTQDPQTGKDGAGIADFLLGTPITATRNIGNTQSYFRRSSYNFYAQDDWKISPRLTLSLGLRYELFTPLTERGDGMITADIQSNNITLVRAGKGDPFEGFAPILLDPAIPYVRDGRFGGHAVTKTDRNNFAPRVGLAWDPTGTQKWSVRAGFGAFYTEDFANTYFDMARNVPKAIKQQVQADPAIPNVSLKQAFGGAGDPITAPTILSTAYDLNTPYSLQWSLMVQRQLPGNLLLEVGYSGSTSHKISVYQIANTAPPGAGAIQPRRLVSKSVGLITPISSLGNANYHSGRFRMEKRFSQGLSFISAYTYSKAIDDATSRASTGQGSMPQNPFRLDLEKALSEYDVRHLYRLGLTYEIPSPRFAKSVLGGWQVGSIVNYLSGNPFTIYASTNANDGGKTRRANVVAGQSATLPSDARGPRRWFNTAAFTDPAPFVYGVTARGIVTGPPQTVTDLSLMKVLSLGDRHRIQFRAEGFNTFNHPNFTRPNTNGQTVGTPGFGTLSNVLPQRQIQFGLKYLF